MVLLSVSAYPEGCSSWLDYITHLDRFEGIAGLPAFYAAHHYLGDAGVCILMASLAALVVTSLIGNLRALSRLCYAAAQDGILPNRFAMLNDKRVPANTILLVVLVSLPIPFLGRTAVGWIVDTTTFGATILYGFVAMAVLKVARREGVRKHTILGAICVPILIAFLGFLLLPELFSDYTIESETYALMIVWSILGLAFFNMIIRKDHARNFGRAIIVWVALLAFIVVLSLTWTSRMNKAKGDVVVDNISAYMDGTADDATLAMDREEFFAIQRERLHDADRDSVLTIAGLFALSLGVLLVNYFSMRKWEQKAAEERDEARVVAFTDPLTGVGSKHAYAIRESAMEAGIVEGDDLEFGVVVCDVNGLKRINDTLGHKAGDEYIRSASQLLCEYYRHSPVFRIGGDEFAVLLEGRDYQDRDGILESLNRRVEGNIGSDGVVASLEMATYDRDVDQSFREVFKRADTLMYERKAQLKGMGAATRD
ncbi:MAG: amino acid permease [Coriobacteriales bacterium]|nr:amino acid permease [Coriobacteriales bacterium]